MCKLTKDPEDAFNFCASSFVLYWITRTFFKAAEAKWRCTVISIVCELLPFLKSPDDLEENVYMQNCE